MANIFSNTNLEQLLRRIKSRLRVNSAKYIARQLSQIGQNGNILNPITLQKIITGEISFQI